MTGSAASGWCYYGPVIRIHIATSIALTIKASATVPTMSSVRFLRWRSSIHPGLLGRSALVSEGRGAGGGMGR